MFAVVGGAALTTTGEVTTAAGTMLMMNSVNNKNKGYYRGKRIGKNEKYGDSGRALVKAKKQIEVLEKQKQGATKKKQSIIASKIKRIRETAQKKYSGNEHSRPNKH